MGSGLKFQRGNESFDCLNECTKIDKPSSSIGGALIKAIKRFVTSLELQPTSPFVTVNPCDGFVCYITVKLFNHATFGASMPSPVSYNRINPSCNNNAVHEIGE